MTRFLASLSLLAFLLTACAVPPTETDVPSLPDGSECLEGTFSLIIMISGEDGDGYDLLFEDGRVFSLHAPAGQVEVTWGGDPVAFTMTDIDGDILTYEEVASTTEVFPVTESDGGGFQTADVSLEPAEDDPPWVAWNCP